MKFIKKVSWLLFSDKLVWEINALSHQFVSNFFCVPLCWCVTDLSGLLNQIRHANSWPKFFFYVPLVCSVVFIVFFFLLLGWREWFEPNLPDLKIEHLWVTYKSLALPQPPKSDKLVLTLFKLRVPLSFSGCLKLRVQFPVWYIISRPYLILCIGIFAYLLLLQKWKLRSITANKFYLDDCLCWN